MRYESFGRENTIAWSVCAFMLAHSTCLCFYKVAGFIYEAFDF